MADNEKINFSNEYPWLLCKLRGNTYAINSKTVASIIHITDDIKIEKSEAEFIRGTTDFLRKKIPLIDMRALLNFESQEEEYNQFCAMIDQRKNDHANWVVELTRCVNEHDTFKLARDPHLCAFGKWYDQFESKINAVNFHMRKIDEPHQKLHEMADEALGCEKKCDECERKECLKVALGKASDEYMPEVVALLEEAKQVFKEEYKEMIIVIDEYQDRFGIVVDEVNAVEELLFLNKNSHAGITFETNIMQGIAKTKKSETLVLLLDNQGLKNVTA